jgi:ring-1,2-phenylacetyl-CoA epoxidase subunit PaaE
MSIHFYPVKIDEIRDETPEAYTLFFQKPDPEVFSYLPGQYLTLRVWVNGEECRRAFSLSSCPVVDHRLSVTIKRVEDGRVSNYLRDQCQAGDTIDVMPPMGKFKLETDQDNAFHYVLIGAGSGITPLMSILKTVLISEPNSRVSLWYGNRTEAGIIFKDELVELGRRFGERLHVYHTLTQPHAGWKGFQGRLDEQRIYELLAELFMGGELRKKYYICGPSGLMDAAERALEKHAVNFDDVNREYYSAPLPTDEELAAMNREPSNGETKVFYDGEREYTLAAQEIVVTLDNKVHKLLVQPNQYILDAAMDAQLDPPYACQSGICTTCRAKLVSGVVVMDETEGLSEDELEQGFVLTCQCHPLSEEVEVVYQ